VRNGTFNAYNFTRHHLTTRSQAEVDENFLIAGVSLPGWFPPVKMDESLYIDAVYVTDANLIAAVENGADELWIMWTVNRGGVWNGGFINTYFQIIEAAANGNLQRDLQRINVNNDAIAHGRAGEFGRAIKVEMLIGRVRLHYLLNFRVHKFNVAVNQGISDAREWCRSRGYPYSERLPLDNEEPLDADSDELASTQAYVSAIRDARFDPRIAPVAVYDELFIVGEVNSIWDRLIRAHDWPRWYPNARNVRIKGGGQYLFLGAEFEWRTFGVALKSVVCEFEPNERVGWRATAVGVDAYHVWTVTGKKGGCLVRTEETQYGWLARASNWWMPNRMHRGHQLWLRRLSEVCGRSSSS
jgi:hypothetical protein